MKHLPQIPGYRMVKKLGQGGMADVYLGVQEKLARPVAIKVMDPLLLRDENFSKRFVKEAQTAAQLTHPNIITIHDVGEIESPKGHFHYIVMEYLEESLTERIRKQERIPLTESLEIIKKIAGALDYAHQKGFIHRDIKPDNIMFRTDGSVVLVDFGIARAVNSATQLTQTGASIGTPYYMSPEQCRGEKIDGRSDIYSLGAQLYEMLTGEVPYKAENTAGIMIKQIQDPLPKLPDHLSAYQPLIDAMMAKDKDMRVQDGKELIAFIDAVLTEPPTLTPPPSDRVTLKMDLPTLVAEEISRVEMQPLPMEEKKSKPFPFPLILITLLTAAVILAIYFMVRTSSPVSQRTINSGTPNNVPAKTAEPLPAIQQHTPLIMGDQTGNKPPEKEKIEEEKPEESPDSQDPAAAAESAPLVSLVELPLEARTQYNQLMERLFIPIPRAGFTVEGQFSADLRVNQTGSVRVIAIENLLTVSPEPQKNRLLKLIEIRLNRLVLPPPKNKEGAPINFKWRLTYKVEKIAKRLILTKL
ncbi:MAG: serine/threonine-protein kinase [Candidatus Omnitrophota bacterium]